MTEACAALRGVHYRATWEYDPNDTERHRGVLERVRDESGWGSKLPAGEGRGVAVHRSFLTYVAAVVRVKVARDGTVTVPRVDIAMDCGFAVHPERVRSQCEGAVVMALSNTMESALTYARGRAVQSNYADYRVLRMAGAPKEIRVHLVDSGGPMGGVGEPGCRRWGRRLRMRWWRPKEQTYAREHTSAP